MTQDEIIEMAREAGLDWHTGWTLDDEEPNRFAILAYLAYDKATEEANARANASWELMCKKMVAFEREACAKIVEESSLPDTYSQECMPDIANDIRARGYKQDGQCKRCKDGCPACDATKLPKEAHDLF